MNRSLAGRLSIFIPGTVWRLGLLAVFAAILAGCAGTPRISAMHDPVYRAETHVSTINVQASEPRDGVREVRIDAVVGELTACSGGVLTLPSLMPCRTNAHSIALTCNFPDVTEGEVSCSLPLGLGPRRMVTYHATARSAGGRTASAGPVTYAGGAPLTEARIGIGGINFTIPWETARPVIWRTDAPSASADPAGRIDLGYVPNADMPTYRAFTDDLQPLVIEPFYTDTNQFSQFTRTWRNLFNFWAGPTGTTAEGCTREFTPPAANVRAVFDGTAILHRNAFQDCASISLGGGAGTTQTTLNDAPWVLIHEAGHFLFGLGDEYAGGGNTSISSPRNVFSSQSACQTASSGEGLPPGQCSEIGSTGTWRNDDGEFTTMEDRVLSSDWRTLSGRAVNNRIAACINGMCY